MKSAASVAQRVVFNMFSPDRRLGSVIDGGTHPRLTRAHAPARRRPRTQSDSPAGERGLMIDQQSLLLSPRNLRPVQFLLPV
jgi:hypothetical protein